jgi:hypothetical protein
LYQLRQAICSSETSTPDDRKDLAADGEVAALDKLPELKQRILEVEQRLLGEWHA